MKTKIEIVYVPSVQHPGTKFLAFTSPEIRMRNLARYYNTPYQKHKKEEKLATAPGAADEIRMALATAQAASLAHRGHRVAA